MRKFWLVEEMLHSMFSQFDGAIPPNADDIGPVAVTIQQPKVAALLYDRV